MDEAAETNSLSNNIPTECPTLPDFDFIQRADYVIYGRLWYFSYCFTVHSNVALSCTKLCQTISQLNVQLCLTLTFSPVWTVRVSGND